MTTPEKKPGIMHFAMWGGIIIHVVGTLGAAWWISDRWGAMAGFLFLAGVGGFWTIWAKEQDQQDANEWLFKPPSRPAPTQFSDMETPPPRRSQI